MVTIEFSVKFYPKFMYRAAIRWILTINRLTQLNFYKNYHIYSRPPAEFDRYYAQVHTPLAKKIPGLRRFEVTRVTGAPSGASDLYLIAELYFDNPAARETALATNEGKAAEADVPKFAEGIVSVYFGVGREP